MKQEDKPPLIKLALILAFITFIVVGVANGSRTPETSNESDKTSYKYQSSKQIIGYNSYIAPKIQFTPTPTYGSLIENIIMCESSGRHNNIWGDAGEYGIAQFLPETFYWMSEISGIDGEWKNKEDQIKILKWAIRNGYGSHWTCYRKLIKN